MTEISRCYAKLHLEMMDFTRIICKMNEAGLKSMVFQAKTTMLKTLGIEHIDPEIMQWIGYSSLNTDHPMSIKGEIFQEDGNIIYVLNLPDHPASSSRVEMGLIYSNPESWFPILSKYAVGFKNALKAVLDGRKSRHMDMGWYGYPTNDKINSYVSFYKSFRYPEMLVEEIALARQIAKRETRSTLLAVAASGMSRETEIKNRKGEEFLEKIQELKDLKLTEDFSLLYCRKTSKLIKAANPTKGGSMNVDKTDFCPYCGTTIQKELVQKAIKLTPIGKKLINSSHWMTILLTDTLIQIGLSKDTIIWNIKEDTEEVDCIVQFKTRIWIFELKDRDFEPGDAHALAYRSIKFKANKTIIVTSGRVNKDARKIFDDLATERAFATDNHPLYIEGITSLAESLKTLVQNETLLGLSEKCKQLSKATQIDLIPVFSKHFGLYTVEYKGNFTRTKTNRF